MATEVLGFLIIMGMLVVVVLNRQLWQRPEPSAPPEDMEDAARRLRREMEQSADEIISRMGAHIDHLERLVAEADERTRRLERQLESLREVPITREDAPPRRRNGFEKMLEASLEAEDRQLPPRRTRRNDASRLTATGWNHAAAAPADVVGRQTPPVKLAPSLEVVVAPSVADVVDLPLDAEEGEITWTAADDQPAEPYAEEAYPPQTEAAAVYESSYGEYPTPQEETPHPYEAPAEYPAEMTDEAAVYEGAIPTYPAEAAAPEEVYEEAGAGFSPAAYPAAYAAEAAGYEMTAAYPGTEPADGTALTAEPAMMAETPPMEETAEQAAYAMETPPPEGGTWETEIPVEEQPPAEFAALAAGTAPGAAAPEMAPVPEMAAEMAPEEDSAVPQEESVWTEEDEEDAIESQQVAEVLQGSRSSVSSRAREMLEQGRSASEVARELNMGRNAIDLLAQMVQRKQAAPH